ncbi:ATP-binding protein [Capilliphycus salinus ALCB114379]|uniref:ATP-binding protein n=1 Tax=Capilliphycus salinus TaxID=2768948 RepID=UPI0039A733B2
MYDQLEHITRQYKILDGVAVGLCLLRSDWTVLFWNRYLEQYTEISKPEIVGTSLFAHFSHLNPEPFQSCWHQVFQQKREVHFTLLSHQWQPNSADSPQKQSPLVQVSLTPVSAIAGQECCALLTLKNSIPPQSDIEPPPTVINEKEIELQKLLDRIAHDLQEPLRMVVNCNQLLAQRYSKELDSGAHQMIHFAVDGGVRMQQMIDSLLVYCRLKTHYQPPQATDAQICLKQAIMDLESLIVQTQAQIQTTPLPEVMANPQQLTQLFSILIENAIKYCSDRPPQIEIAVQPQTEMWVFSVQDNGIGIDSKYHQAIFDIFQRLHPRQNYPGIGMGLAIAKRIVELDQGSIWVDSHSQQGSTFYFTLPRPHIINPLLTSSENP